MALLAISVPAGAFGAAPAMGEPPPNDAPAGAGVFTPYAAPNGDPKQLQAGAQVREATRDRGVPRCLGSRSFARTVWYRIPEAPTARRLTIEAAGTTTNVVDLAAFVQPEVLPPPPPPPPPAPARAKAARSTVNLSEPNACDGVGAGGADAAADPTSAVTLFVPPNYPVLVQVGRRGRVRSARDEVALVTLEQRDLGLPLIPAGDFAGPHTPVLSGRAGRVRLAGATISPEDPAQPPCPSLGTVWRRFVPTSTGRQLIGVSGASASTLTVFKGSRPTGGNVVDCVDRDDSGPMEMAVDVRRGRPVWVRVGVDSPFGVARLTHTPAGDRTVIDGGPGGYDPTPFGAAGGLPGACDGADADAARVTGPRLTGRAAPLNRRRRVTIRLRVRRSAICDAQVRLLGPRGQVYAEAELVRLKQGRSKLRLPRLRTLVAGRYRLSVSGLSGFRGRASAKAHVRGRLEPEPKQSHRP